MIVLSLMFSGCIPLASDIQNVGRQTLLLSETVDSYQKEVMDIKALVEKDGLISEETANRIDKLSEEFDRIQPTLEDVATAIKDADYVDGETFRNAIKGLQAANIASSPVNPYAPLIQVLLGLVATVGTGYGIKKRSDANAEAAKRKADKEGRELTLREIATMPTTLSPEKVKELMYKNIGNARAHNGVT
jgi:hypothetical protein